MTAIAAHGLGVWQQLRTLNFKLVTHLGRVIVTDTARHPANPLPVSPVELGERRLAIALVLLSLVIFLLAAPFARIPLPRLELFIPTYELVVLITDLSTAYLLFNQFSVLQSRALLPLAGGYLFTASIVIPHALTFPGLFAPAGLLGAGPQSTAWLYMFWHGLFPPAVIFYALLKEEGATRRAIGSPRIAILCSVLVVAATVCGLAWLATAGAAYLPAIMEGDGYTPLMKLVVTMVWLSSLAAFVLLWIKRPHSVLDLWLMVVMCAWMFDVALSAVLNAGRFDLGFYVGRIYGFVAASFVLVMLQMAALDARLARPPHSGSDAGSAPRYR
jgi:hypothetical protein